LALALAAASARCATSHAVPRPFPSPAPREIARTPAPFDPMPLVATALALTGTPYRHGGAGPAGFDCSGFTRYVFGLHGITLPRDTREQFDLGRSVEVNELQPGDLIFFSTVASGPSHVGIAIGGREFVHAPSSRGVVRIDRMDSRYWAARVVGARRVTPP
jgi:cell wall-associated NlpC family hydrolase